MDIKDFTEDNISNDINSLYKVVEQLTPQQIQKYFSPDSYYNYSLQKALSLKKFEDIDRDILTTIGYYLGNRYEFINELNTYIDIAWSIDCELDDDGYHFITIDGDKVQFEIISTNYVQVINWLLYGMLSDDNFFSEFRKDLIQII